MAEPGQLIIPGVDPKAVPPAAPAAPAPQPVLPKTVEILGVICHRSWNAAIEYQERTAASFDAKTGMPKIAPQLLQISSLKAHPCVTTSCMMFDVERRLCLERVLIEEQIARLRRDAVMASAGPMRPTAEARLA